jgi:hypothetical protein
MSRWKAALLATTAVHAGFQATVTLLVYPALARVPVEDWAAAHVSHSRRITPLVVTVYGGTLVACAGSLVDDPGSVGIRVAVAGTAAAYAVTALSAAPTHGRLAGARTDELVHRLLRADRLRLVAALVALAGAAVHGSGA